MYQGSLSISGDCRVVNSWLCHTYSKLPPADSVVLFSASLCLLLLALEGKCLVRSHSTFASSLPRTIPSTCFITRPNNAVHHIERAGRLRESVWRHGSSGDTITCVFGCAVNNVGSISPPKHFP